MSAVVSGKVFSTLDEEEDALLNEAISCSRNLEMKADDEEIQKKEEVKNIQTSSKRWCDSDSSSNHSELSLSHENVDLSLSSDDEDPSTINRKKCDDKTCRPDVKSEPGEAEAAKDKCIKNEIVKTEPENDAEMNKEESNGRNCKRVRDKEEGDCYPKVPKNRRNSSSSSSTLSSNGRPKKIVEYETDPAVLARRQKDVDYGKNTVGYDRYVQKIPRPERERDHPRTPPMHIKCSRRAWDGMVKLWRKQLHFWDPQNETKNIEEDV